jgi:hypothetical protein
MKKLFVIVFLTSFVNSLPAQTFQSRKEDGNCAQISIRYDGSTVYYHLDRIDGNCADYQMMFVNRTNIQVINKKFIIPDDGRTYWMISFEASEPPHMAERQNAYCVSCSSCAWPSFATCDSFCMGAGGGYCCGQCVVCDTHIYKCAGGFSLRNGVVLVQATTVIME